jgi:hypothetical protein
MARFTLGRRLSALVVPVLTLALIACGASAKPTSTPASAPGSTSIPNAFIGTVPGTDAFVALTTTGGSSLSYVCDAKQISTWFGGPVTNNALDITAANGNHLKATLATSGATGTLTLAGKDFPFTAAPAKGDAGLFRAEQEVSGSKVIGGWILSGDGQQRGALQSARENRDEITAAPQLLVAQKASPTTWTVQTPTFGSLTVKRVVDPEDHRG